MEIRTGPVEASSKTVRPVYFAGGVRAWFVRIGGPDKIRATATRPSRGPGRVEGSAQYLQQIKLFGGRSERKLEDYRKTGAVILFVGQVN